MHFHINVAERRTLLNLYACGDLIGRISFPEYPMSLKQRWFVQDSVWAAQACELKVVSDKDSFHTLLREQVSEPTEISENRKLHETLEEKACRTVKMGMKCWISHGCRGGRLQITYQSLFLVHRRGLSNEEHVWHLGNVCLHRLHSLQCMDLDSVTTNSMQNLTYVGPRRANTSGITTERRTPDWNCSWSMPFSWRWPLSVTKKNGPILGSNSSPAATI